MAVSTVDEYLSALEKSKLLGSEQLVEAQRLAVESSDAETLAKALARENLVSRWQAGTILALGQRAQLRLGKYKLIQRLGKGGMGTVFLAEHVTMNRRVALKIVPRSIAEDRASLDRFFAERERLPRSIIPISFRPIASTMKWTAISSSWNSSTARICNGWSNSTARWTSAMRQTTSARPPRDWPMPTPATLFTAISSPRTCC